VKPTTNWSWRSSSQQEFIGDASLAIKEGEPIRIGNKLIARFEDSSPLNRELLLQVTDIENSDSNGTCTLKCGIIKEQTNEAIRNSRI
jgi:hypothetical protein